MALKIFKDKPKIYLDNFNYKQLINFKWNNIVKWITHLYYFILYNLIFSSTWYFVINNTDFNHNLVNNTGHYGAIITTGAFHILVLGIQGITAHFHKSPKVDKVVYTNEYLPTVKLRKVGLILVIISVIPSLIWCIGKIVIIIKCKKYYKLNGNYDRIENNRQQAKYVEEKVNDKASEFLGKIVKNVVDK